ncbi:MAG TPA: flippase activity-associated protein Agl23 [Desulfuromonadaceae bacterium]|jgi:uncharacterized protein (TIGR03663 family)
MLRQLSVVKRETYAAAIFLAIGSILRLYHLKLVPLHHDEGVNGFFMLKLFREGLYRYDPANYHGPLLYYLDLPLLKLLGLETGNLRLLPALFGIGLLVLLQAGKLFSLRSALFSMALVAISPGMVYISRYFIHEMMVVVFTLGVVVALNRYKEQPALGIIAAFTSAGLLFATKETAAPTLVVLAIAGGMTQLWMGPPVRVKMEQESEKHPLRWLTNLPVMALLAGVVVFCLINLTLYSSFYANLHGLLDALRSLAFWTAIGNHQHVHPFWQYLVWLMEQEGPLFLLGWAGILRALLLRSSSQAVFCGFWSLGMLAMYSLIPYKTPWLALNIILPFALMAGYALEEGTRIIGNNIKVVAATCAILVGLAQCISLNFIHYDDNSCAYVYAHTVRDLDRLVRDVEKFGQKCGTDIKVAVVSDQYWPLPWMWRDFKGALFYGKLVPLDDIQMVLALPSQEDEVRKSVKPKMAPYRSYTLRPGVDLVLWADRSITDNSTNRPAVTQARVFHKGTNSY